MQTIRVGDRVATEFQGYVRGFNVLSVDGDTYILDFGMDLTLTRQRNEIILISRGQPRFSTEVYHNTSGAEGVRVYVNDQMIVDWCTNRIPLSATFLATGLNMVHHALETK